jgi:hypothetical protein
VNDDLVKRQGFISELQHAAKPLRDNCDEEVGKKIDTVVNEAVEAWEKTSTELKSLCTRYQNACKLWQQYRDSSAAVKVSLNIQMNNVANLPPGRANEQIKVGVSRHETDTIVKVIAF